MNWYCFVGTSASTAPSGTLPAFVNSIYSGPLAGRHTTVSGTATDRYGGFSVVAPGGGGYSFRLGSDSANYASERIWYFLHVPAGVNNYALNFKCAVVLGGTGHALYEQPAFTVKGIDSATGNALPCANLSYTTAGTTGFIISPINSQVSYLPWTSGTLNLSGMAGKTVIVEVSALGCAQGNHFGYGYFDIIGCGLYNAAVTYCDLTAGIISLTAPQGYANYRWFKGPVIVGAPVASTSVNTVNLPISPTPSFYYCVLTPYSNNGCQDTIKSRTVPNFTIHASPDTICGTWLGPIQLTCTITGGSGGHTISWLSNIDFDTSTGPNPVVNPRGHGPYVVIVADSVGCFRYDSVITTNAPFSLSLGPDITTCLHTAVTLSPALNPSSLSYSYLWIGSNTAATLNNPGILRPVYTSTKAGWDTLVFQANTQACSSIDTIVIRSLSDTLHIDDTTICQNTVLYPNVVGDTSFSYSWLPLSGIVQGQEHLQFPQLITDTSRVYTVTGSYPGCPDISASFRLIVEPQPIVDLGQDTIAKACNAPLLLHANVTPSSFNSYTYLWADNDQLDSLYADHAIFSGIHDTTILITVATPLGCMGQDSVRIQIYPAKFAAVTPSDSAVCLNNPVTLTASGGVSYLWTPGTYLDDTAAANVTARPGADIAYTLYVTDFRGCQDTLAISLRVADSAFISLPHQAILYEGQSYQMHPDGNAVSWSWYPTTGLDNPAIANPIASPAVNTQYFVTGTNAAGCFTTDSIYILYRYGETVIDMPNAFSPGGSANAVFKVCYLGQASLKSFRIYDRWGNKVFETRDINQGWNGEYHGSPQPQGVYIYRLEAVINGGTPFIKNGNVSLIR